ncbi:MAG: chromosomal replication initiator protein DnaA [Treponema sp.]|jgi:chromosomal replication initiator protein|nr:chromosomal replication initiator protein DnaA [Treponema sp.]
MAKKGDYKALFDEALEELRVECGEDDYFIWLGKIGFLSASGPEEMQVSVPSAFFLTQFKRKFLARLQEKLSSLAGTTVTVSLKVDEDAAAAAAVASGQQPKPAEAPDKASAPQSKDIHPTEAPRAPRKQLPSLREDFTFDNYIIGEDNKYAAKAADVIARNPGSAYNPVLIYGGVGLGKTHLMQAIGNYIHFNSNLRVTYITAENFLNEFLEAMNSQKMNSFKNKFRYTTDVLLLDDIQFFEGKEQTQEELFHTFNALADSKKQVVFTCDRLISDLKKIPERLTTRFESGLKVDLKPLKYETRILILRSINETKKANIPAEIIDLVGKNVASNVRDLLSAFKNLIAYQDLTGRPITLVDAQKQMRDLIGSPRQPTMSIDIILKAVADEFHLSHNDLRSKKKSKNVVTPRHIAMYLAREITEYSTTEIGAEFGKDHATVIFACRKVDTRLKTEPDFYEIVENCKRKAREYSMRN